MSDLDQHAALPHPLCGGLLPALGAGALSGVLYGLSLPKADLGWLAWICLLPILAFALHCHDRPGTSLPRHLLLGGLTFGVVAGGFRVYWIIETLGSYGGLGLVESAATTCLLVLYLGLYPMLFVRLCTSAWSSSSDTNAWVWPWLAAASWALLDWVQTWMLSGFPWAVLGTTQYRVPVVASFAALAGVHGLSFVIVACNSGLILILFARLRSQRLAGAAAVVAVLVAVFLWGSAHQHALSSETPAQPLRIGIVQGNIRQDVKWQPGWKDSTTKRYVDLTRTLISTSGAVDLVVWPETALPFRLDDAAHAAHRLAVTRLAVELNTPLFIGSLGTTSVAGPPGLYNRAFLFDRDGQLSGSGDKVHLVPFGEYMPLPWIFDYMRELTAQSGAFDPGMEHTVIPLEAREPGGQVQQLGLFVCFESNFPSITRELTRKGAGILVNTTNDAWFGTTAAPYQHFAMVVLRAVETGRPVIRAANTGISGAIAPDGRVLQATDLFTTRTLVVDVHPRAALTPYVRFGDVIIGLSAVIWGGFLLWLVHRRRTAVLRQIGAAACELQQLATRPVPLQRPIVLLPGYDSSTTAMSILREHLEICFTGTSGRIIDVDLRHDLSVRGLAELTRGSLPMEPCDYIGHSLGGVIATAAARDLDDNPWVFALASPFRGTGLAQVACWFRYPFLSTLTDLRVESPDLTPIRQRSATMTGFRALRLLGDPVPSGLPGRLVHTYPVPILLGPLQRHRAIHADPRAILHIVRALRSRPYGRTKKGDGVAAVPLDRCGA